MQLIDLATFGVLALHCIVSPYAKVEESFNLHAVYDILHHAWDIDSYDHLQYPGVVPRTFVGSLFLAVFSYMPARIFQNHQQLVVRLVLGWILVYSMHLFRKAVAKAYSPKVATIFQLCCMSQFHLMYYGTRTLPNIFALCIVLISYAAWLRSDFKKLVLCAAAAGIIFRSELVILYGPLLLLEIFWYSKISLSQIISISVTSAAVCLLLTVLVDSFFWQRWLYPEGEVLYYNTYLNKSSNWGTSPWYYYFLIHLPKLLLCMYPFCLIQSYSISTRRIFTVALCYVFLYSFLPHKEWRFIIYVVPLLNVVAAVQMDKLSRYRYLKFIVYGCLMTNFALSSFYLHVSSYNYPGGLALQQLHELVPVSNEVSVHIAADAAMTGVSLFGFKNSKWIYSKTENLSSFEKFTHLITSQGHAVGFKVFKVVNGYDRIEVGMRYPYIKVILKPKMYLHQNQNKFNSK